MQNKLFYGVALLVVVGLLALVWPEGAVRHPPGILVTIEPKQEAVTANKQWVHKDFRFTALATYDIEARLLSKARYRFDRDAGLSPLDFALGWGCMSDQAVIDKLDINQNGRWYVYRWQNPPPLAREEIGTHSANTHLIPSNDEVFSQLLRVKVGNVVRLQGYLVSIDGREGYNWTSSLSRSDDGGHSCEVMWVESVSVK
jgi:hypothetical protein